MIAVVVEDDAWLREELKELAAALPGVTAVRTAGDGEAARAALEGLPPPDLVLLDVHLPRDAAEARTGRTVALGPALAACARKAAPAARIVVVSGIDPGEAAALLETGAIDDFVSKETPFPEIRARVAAQARAAGQDRTREVEELVGDSPALVAVRAWIAKVAASPAPVLVTGESGCGKELVALRIHRLSPFARGPFVPFHAAAVSETLLEAELFGHKKGAFTGAAESRAGVVEAAEGGTLFLDEIGELPEAFQVKLLRFLESGSFHRLGEDKPRQARVRLVFATHRDLGALVEAGRFRADLLYRLDVLRVEVPPLRARPADVGPIARHLLAGLAARQGRRAPELSAAAEAALTAHSWPGNVRELRNVLERALLLGEGTGIDAQAVALAIGPARPGTGASTKGPGAWSAGLTLAATLEAAERAALERALEHHGGNVTHTAKALGLGRRTLQGKMARHGLRGGDDG